MVYRLRDLREDHDYKQRELAAYLNCSQQVYSNYELGQRDIPTEVLIKLAEFYQVSIDYMYDEQSPAQSVIAGSREFFISYANSRDQAIRAL